MRTHSIVGCLVLGGILALGTPSAQAGQFIGTLCWQMEVEGESYNVPFFVTQMAPGFYLLHGAPVSTAESYPLFQGAAQMRDDKLCVSIRWTVTDGPQRETAQGEFSLNPHTLSGSGWFFWKTHWTDLDETYEGYKEDIQLSLVPCQ